MRSRHSSSVARSTSALHTEAARRRSCSSPAGRRPNTSTGSAASDPTGSQVANSPRVTDDRCRRRPDRAAATGEAAAHHAAGGEVVGEASVVGAAFVPDRDVVLVPSPPALQVRILERGAEELQQRGALVGVHACDPAHERTTEVQRGSAGHRVHAHQWLTHRFEALDDLALVRPRRRGGRSRRPRARGRAPAPGRATTSCTTGESESYAPYRLTHIVSPPSGGAVRMLNTATSGGSRHEGDVGVPPVRLRRAVRAVLEGHEHQVLAWGPGSPRRAARTPTRPRAAVPR